MPTLTLSFVGTGHFRVERYNLMVVVHSLVDAIDISEPGSQIPEGGAADAQYKMLFDGPDLLGGGRGDAESMDSVRARVLAVLKGRPDVVVNMVGHSRGAINGIMIADEMQRVHNMPNRVNMFCLDAAKNLIQLSNKSGNPAVAPKSAYRAAEGA